ncbi:Uncharacterised protein [Mycobacterium tuberculosis]|nr:Uncharacterised protein [Mycobacterium tuberculosis]
MGPYFFPRVDSICAFVKTLSIDHSVAPPTSMYSMNLTSALTLRANSIRSDNSSSLKPRITTESSFVSVKPAAATASMPSITL